MRKRIRIRFRKEEDLRLISHRDLLRTFERLFRRADLKLSMSEGYHPKARMNFPSALALGVVGLGEVMEFELTEELEADEIADRLRALAPPGLIIHEVRRVEQDEPKPRVKRFEYQFPVPEDRRASVQRAIDQLLAKASHPIKREGRAAAIDLRAGLDCLEMHDGVLEIGLVASNTASVRPSEVLDELGIGDLATDGFHLIRTAVELAH